MEPERCEDCGFDATRLTVTDAVAALRSLGRRWRELFKDVPDDVLRARPEPDTWSPLEYAAHTRDVTKLVGWGMDQALETDGQSFPGIEEDPLGADHGYNALDPETVLSELEAEADAVAARAEAARPGAWSHKAKLSDETLSAEWFPKHIVHDATHHLRDVERGLRQLGAR
jgi:hypothetical protein